MFLKLHAHMYTDMSSARNSIAINSNSGNTSVSNASYSININRCISKYYLYSNSIKSISSSNKLTKGAGLHFLILGKVVFIKRLILHFWLNLRLGSLINNPKGTTNTFVKNYSLYFNFKRNRFFPYFFMNFKCDTIFNNSLGIVSKHFSLKKAFLKSKSSYLMSAVYLRRIFTYLGVNISYLNIIKTPKFLKDILSSFLTNSNSLYNHPFKNSVVNEKQSNVSLYFYYVNFINNKALGEVKRKKKGRLKRKISKKVTLYNNLID